MTEPQSRVLAFLKRQRKEGDDGGYSAAEIGQEVGGSYYGGRSVAGELGQLERAGDAELVARTDGRTRPLLYRATESAPAETMRSLVRVLMRGDRATGRRGEIGTKAVLAACSTAGVDTDAALADIISADKTAALELLAYAYGYAVGLNDDWLTVDPLCDDHAVLVREGYEHGLAEDPAQTLPAGVGDRKSWDGDAIRR